MFDHALDAHVHCGIQDQSPPQALEDYLACLRGTPIPITAAVMFPPVLEVYDRFDPHFRDSPTWRKRRKRANAYLLGLRDRAFTVIPYLFIWNDFDLEQLRPEIQGIKWHRHPGEPEYNYGHAGCRLALEAIRARNLPVVLEEELDNTIRFIRDLAPGVRVVIPHLGGLNGGYQAIKQAGLFALPNVYTDTALADSREIMDYCHAFGRERIFFGSDFPFGHPVQELQKILDLPLDQETKHRLIIVNAQRMLSQNKT